MIKLTVVRLTAPSVTGPVDSHELAAASKAAPAARSGPSVSVPGENARGSDTPPAARHGLSSYKLATEARLVHILRGG